MEQPPEAVLEERSNHHLIVTLADIALVMEALHSSEVNASKLLIQSLHLLNSMLTDLFVEVSARCIHLRIKLILLPDQPAHKEDKFLLDRVGVFSHLQRCWHELVLGQLHAQTLTELNGVRDVSHRLLFGATRSKDKPRELVVV